MERKLIIALLLFSLLLAGCNATTGLQSSLNSESFESSASFDEEIPKKYQPYSIYLFDMKFSFVAPPIVVNTPKIYMRNEVVEEGVASQTLDLLFTQVDSQYYNSKSTIGIRAALSRHFVTQYGSVMLDSATGKVVELNFKVSDKIDTNKEAKKITQEECDAILLEYLNHLGSIRIKGITNYKCPVCIRSTKEQAMPAIYTDINLKSILTAWRQVICALSVLRNTAVCFITNVGMRWMMQKSKHYPSTINERKLWQRNMPKMYVTASIPAIVAILSSPYLLMLDDGSYAVWYAIDIQLGKNGKETGLSIIIPVS